MRLRVLAGFESRRESQFAVRGRPQEDDTLHEAPVQTPICQTAVAFEARSPVDIWVSDQRATGGATRFQQAQAFPDQGLSNALSLPVDAHRNRTKADPVVVSAIDRNR